MRGALLIFFSVLASEVACWEANITCPVDFDTTFKKKCSDDDGNTYKAGATIDCDCYSAVCEKITKKILQWVMLDNDNCCNTNGTWFYEGCIISSTPEGPCSRTDEICERDSISMEMEIVPHLNVTGCSVNGGCLPTFETIPWAEKCGEIACVPDPWYPFIPTLEYESVYEGCNCCLFEEGGYQLENGQTTWWDDREYLCCEGTIYPIASGGEWSEWSSYSGVSNSGISGQSTPDSETTSTDSTSSTTTNWEP
jgi:hypothetical protein